MQTGLIAGTRPSKRSELLLRRRVRLIRSTSRWIDRLARTRPGLAALRAAQRTPITRGVLRALAGFRRPFATLAEARAAALPFLAGEHANADNAVLHRNLSERPRPSDYAALFHLQRLGPDVGSVFDCGGNVGNLFYCYSRYIDLSRVQWTVFDVPEMMTIGRELAVENGASQLAFTTRFADCAGADLLLASGSLHYFDPGLPCLLGALERRPRFVLINRTPLIDAEQIATVQDAGAFRAACVLYNKAALVSDFCRLGYALHDSWDAAECSMRVPGYPQYSVPHYSGLLFGPEGRNPG